MCSPLLGVFEVTTTHYFSTYGHIISQTNQLIIHIPHESKALVQDAARVISLGPFKIHKLCYEKPTLKEASPDHQQKKKQKEDG